MPSRKQRRRRQKERRHEYEYVYVDDEGQEVELPPDEREKRPQQTGNGRRDRPDRARGGRLREYQPPSWKRSVRRAALFFPLFFIVFSLVNKDSAIVWRVLTSLVYSALFVPLTYLMDRTAYRTYLRRSGGERAKRR